MITFEAVQESIAHYATQISKELAERNIYDPKEFQAFLKVRLHDAINEIVSIETEDLEKQRQDLAAQLTPNISKQEKLRIEYKLKVLRPRLKELNRVKKSFEDYSEYVQLKHYIEERYGYGVIEDFYQNYLNRDQNNIHTSKRK